MLATISTLTAILFAQSSPPQHTWSIDPSHSVVQYTVTHKLHRVSAEAHEIEGKVAVGPDGKARVMVRIPVAAFKSGDGNRDAHMLEVLDASQYSHVIFKAAAPFALPTAMPASRTIELAGQLELHGRKELETVPLTLNIESPSRWRVRGSFKVSLDKYQVERPSLLFVKIEDACAIDLDLQLKEDGT